MSRWYIIHAYSGFENKVRDSIMAEATRMGLDRLVESVEVPTEKVTEVRRGKKVTSDRKFFPGYVLAKLQMSDDVYHLVKNTPKVTGFLGSMGKPQPISETEAARMLGAQPWELARRITFPLLMPTTLFVAINAVINSFKLVDHLVIMTKGGPSNASSLLLYYIYEVAFTFQDSAYAATLTVVLLVVLSTLALIKFGYLDRRIHYQ